MPHLDFMTLYILIFLNSLTVSAVWAGFAWMYRPHTAAQYWLAGTLLSLVGGLVLATQGNEGALVPAVLGNTIIILGFAQFWIGLRRFDRQQGGWTVAIAFTVAAAALMIALHDSGRGRAIVYASGQSIVMLACLFQLLRKRFSGIGTRIAASLKKAWTTSGRSALTLRRNASMRRVVSADAMEPTARHSIGQARPVPLLENSVGCRTNNRTSCPRSTRPSISSCS